MHSLVLCAVEIAAGGCVHQQLQSTAFQSFHQPCARTYTASQPKPSLTERKLGATKGSEGGQRGATFAVLQIVAVCVDHYIWLELRHFLLQG
eukprot:3939658-Rhodomonas_salina.1